MTGVSAIAVGGAHALALKGGRVIAWGDDFYGQATVPAEAESGVDAIAAGGSFSLALHKGKVIAWGSNDAGELAVPTAAQSGVTAIAAGGNFALALKGGMVIAWGDNFWDAHVVPREARAGITAIAAGADHALALRAGKVIAWGGDPYSGVTDLPDSALTSVTAIAAGGNLSLAIKQGGVIGWGNYAGLMGVPSAAKSGVSAVAAGHDHVLALKEGRVIAWGSNEYGQSSVPIAALSGVSAVAAGGATSMAIGRGPSTGLMPVIEDLQQTPGLDPCPGFAGVREELRSGTQRRGSAPAREGRASESTSAGSGVNTKTLTVDQRRVVRLFSVSCSEDSVVAVDVCSGVLITSELMLTADHCRFRSPEYTVGLVRMIAVISPIRVAATSRESTRVYNPAGTCEASFFWNASQAPNSADLRGTVRDIAVLRLTECDEPALLESIGGAALDTSALSALTASPDAGLESLYVGYPGDKPLESQVPRGPIREAFPEMWEMRTRAEVRLGHDDNLEDSCGPEVEECRQVLWIRERIVSGGSGGPFFGPARSLGSQGLERPVVSVLSVSGEIDPGLYSKGPLITQEFCVSLRATTLGASLAPPRCLGMSGQLPVPPTEVIARAGNSSVTVSWTPVWDPTGGPIQYTVTTIPSGKTCVTQRSSCRIGGLINGVAYTFHVRADNSIGSSSPSPASRPATPLAPPGPVRDLVAKGVRGGVAVAWVEPSLLGGADRILRYDYQVTRGTDTEAWRSTPKTEVAVNARKGELIRVTVVAVTAAASKGVPSTSNWARPR